MNKQEFEQAVKKQYSTATFKHEWQSDGRFFLDVVIDGKRYGGALNPAKTPDVTLEQYYDYCLSQFQFI